MHFTTNEQWIRWRLLIKTFCSTDKMMHTASKVFQQHCRKSSFIMRQVIAATEKYCHVVIYSSIVDSEKLSASQMTTIQAVITGSHKTKLFVTKTSKKRSNSDCWAWSLLRQTSKVSCRYFHCAYQSQSDVCSTLSITISTPCQFSEVNS